MRDYLLFCLLFLLTVNASAQNEGISSWLIPEIGSTNELVLRGGDGYEDVASKTHSDLSATFNSGGEVELFVEYDMVNRQLCGGKLTYHRTDWLTFYAGILKNPYIAELSISPRNLEAVGYSMAAGYLGGYGSDLSGISARGRDIGLLADARFFKMDKNFSILRAQLGVFNGNGFSFRDNDNHKDVSGRIDLKPAKDWTVSVGAMYGKYSIHDGRGKVYRTTDENVTTTSRSRISTALWFDNSKGFLRLENVYGKTDGMRSNNISCLLGWWINQHLSPSARYESFKKDLDDNGSRTSIAALCLTYKFNKDINVRCQFNHKWFSDGTDAMNSVSLALNVKLNYKP